MKDEYGFMIRLLREKMSISMEQLSRGLVSVADLSRIETGDKEIVRPLHEALLQRLGKSIGKLENLLSEEEYACIILREKFIEIVLKSKLHMFEALEEEYLKYTWDCPLERQFILMMKAITMYIRGNTKKECCQILQNALKETHIDWPITDFSKYFFCIQEIQVILLHEYMKETQEKNILEQLKIYIEHHYTDQEMKVKVYPQCLWRLAELYQQEHKYQKAYRITEQAIKCLTENGVITLLVDFLEQKLLYISKLGIREQETELIQKQIKALHFMYEIVDYYRDRDKIYNCIHINRQMDVTISNELIYNLRLQKNMSQEELGEEICSRETISRIERGRNSPNKKNLQKMLQKLGFENGDYLGLDTCYYEMLEKVRFFRKAVFSGDLKKASIILNQIERELDHTSKLNKQFLESARHNLNLLNQNPDYKQIQIKLTKLLTYTMKDYKGIVYRVPSRTENEILMGIVNCMKSQNHLQEARNLLESIRMQYDKSKVIDIHRTVSAILFYYNYSSVLELMDDLYEAEKMAKKALEIAIHCHRGEHLDLIIANLACVYEKRKQLGDEERGRNHLKCSYYLLILFRNEKRAELVKNHFFIKYNSNIN